MYFFSSLKSHLFALFFLKKHGADQTELDFLSQEYLLHEDPSPVEGSDIEKSRSNEETIEDNECAYDAECTTRQEQIATESLRQRTKKQSSVVRMQLAVTLC